MGCGPSNSGSVLVNDLNLAPPVQPQVNTIDTSTSDTVTSDTMIKDGNEEATSIDPIPANGHVKEVNRNRIVLCI